MTKKRKLILFSVSLDFTSMKLSKPRRADMRLRGFADNSSSFDDLSKGR